MIINWGRNLTDSFQPSLIIVRNNVSRLYNAILGGGESVFVLSDLIGRLPAHCCSIVSEQQNNRNKVSQGISYGQALSGQRGVWKRDGHAESRCTNTQTMSPRVGFLNRCTKRNPECKSRCGIVVQVRLLKWSCYVGQNADVIAWRKIRLSATKHR